MDQSFITIVSGLPRSGTSMMMQAINAGGMDAVTDNIRERDEDNPKGYYEFELVKKTKEDASWLEEAGGKVVKMVYRLLYDLPAEGYEYRIVFMRRNMDEVLQSQKKMLARMGKNDSPVSDDEMKMLFKKQLADFDKWIEGRKNFSIIDVSYTDMINNTMDQCVKINDFLDGSLDVEKMASVVDGSLYRNRK